MRVEGPEVGELQNQSAVTGTQSGKGRCYCTSITLTVAESVVSH